MQISAVLSSFARLEAILTPKRSKVYALDSLMIHCTSVKLQPLCGKFQYERHQGFFTHPVDRKTNFWVTLEPLYMSSEAQ